MRSVALDALEGNLSQYIRLVATGEIVLVTDRERVVAELGPPQPSRNALLGNERLADAVRAGWITPAPLAGSGIPPAAPTKPFETLMEELERDREDR